MHLTLGEAAKATGKAKSTISKALKSGKLSHEGKTSAGYQINAAELFRVFPKPQENTPIERLETPEETPSNALLEQELKHLRDKLNDAEDRIEELKVEKDEWRAQAKITSNLIEDMREKTSSDRAGGGWWPFGKGK